MSADNDNDPMSEEMPDFAGPDGAERELAGLKAEIEAQRDRALRALAEIENVRKRLERERDEARAYSVTRFARDMLTVADNLNRALSAFPAEAPARSDDSVKAVLDGVEATARELSAALARHGVKPIEAQGQRFDPHLHQAIAEVLAPGTQPGTVVTVVQPGYMIGERLLRPAMVTVAKAGGQGTPSPNGAGQKLDSKI